MSTARKEKKKTKRIRSAIYRDYPVGEEESVMVKCFPVGGERGVGKGDLP